MIDEEDGFIHKGLQRLWDSGGADHSGITPSNKKNVQTGLVHLSIARSVKDIQSGWGVSKEAKLLSGHSDRYSMKVNHNYRLTFTCDASGRVSKIDLEDTHGPTGAKRH